MGIEGLSSRLSLVASVSVLVGINFARRVFTTQLSTTNPLGTDFLSVAVY